MYTDFIQNHKVFDASMSEQCRKSMVRTLQGLGLPTPYYSKVEPWGYKRDGMIYMPVETDLQIFLKSLEMIESKQYLLPDVWEWFNSAPITRKLGFRAFKYARSDRPVFPEMKLSPQERIAIVYRTDQSKGWMARDSSLATSSASQENSQTKEGEISFQFG